MPLGSWQSTAERVPAAKLHVLVELPSRAEPPPEARQVCCRQPGFEFRLPARVKQQRRCPWPANHWQVVLGDGGQPAAAAMDVEEGAEAWEEDTAGVEALEESPDQGNSRQNCGGDGGGALLGAIVHEQGMAVTPAAEEGSLHPRDGDTCWWYFHQLAVKCQFVG